MGILNTEVEITLNSATIKYYENLGYEILRKRNKWGKITVPRGTKLKVAFSDLQIYSGIKLDAECDNCGATYKIYNENYRKTNRDGKIYCNKCAKKLFNSGINHPLYKPDISQEERENGRFYPEYVDFIKRVLKRDDYTCQCCGKKSESDMNVHHLNGYNWCIEKRTDDTNGISLCETCHSNFHAIYGNGYNTREQFEEWIGYKLNELKEFDGELTPTRKIFSYEESKIYNSATEYIIAHNMKSTSSIYHVCKRDKNHRTVNGQHLFWYDEYIMMSEEEILKIVNRKLIRNRKKVICLTTNKIYDSIREASEKEHISASSISNCCEKKQESVVSKQDNRRTRWMFYDEYLESIIK